ncbi:type V CRISPR-associated protein Cas4 [Candidatus Gottesmanbacteria bacterium]|nr:type V CRISPR-associated protein Cas4 [Candidatus Gottesmanbacteria bacterium]
MYLHTIYSSFETSVYHDAPQTRGAIAHENIEDGLYTTARHILQGLSVYSVRLGIKGKIDIYDGKEKCLIERKYRISHVYDGYRYQLYAQMYCLEEAGHSVKQLFLHSFSDNKRYAVPVPTAADKKRFEDIVSRMKSFDAASVQDHTCSHCANNIYGLLSW